MRVIECVKTFRRNHAPHLRYAARCPRIWPCEKAFRRSRSSTLTTCDALRGVQERVRQCEKLSSLTFHLRSHAPLITRASSASPRCSSPAGAFGAAHHARFLYGLVAHVLHHGESERPLLETSQDQAMSGWGKNERTNGQTDKLKLYGLVPLPKVGNPG